MSQLKPIIHGADHSPGGADPSHAERWHKCGDTGEPALGAGMTGKAWFRFVVGRKTQRTHVVEVMIAVDGGADGDTIFTLPTGYFDFAEGDNVPGNGQDAAGEFRPYYIDGVTGDVIVGPMP